MQFIRILLVDDQSLFREGLRTLLSVHPGLEVVGEAAHGEEALRLARERHPSVVLMDLRMPVMDGVETTRRFARELPGARVLVLTTFDDDALVFEALRAGAAGYLLKDASSEKLVEAIRAVHRGESVLQPSVTAKVLSEFNRLSRSAPAATAPGPELTERETAVLRLLSGGASNKEIASALSLAEGTVKNHVTRILEKFGVTDRTQAALKARELGL